MVLEEYLFRVVVCRNLSRWEFDVNPYRILLVRPENVWNPQTEEVFRSSLEKLGALDVAITATGEEAVAEARSGPVDVVIADLVLPRPGMSGSNALIRVRELCPGCRTVLVSDHDYVARLLSDVADVFLVRSKESESSALGLRLAGVMDDFVAARGPHPKAFNGANFNSEATTLQEEVTTIERPTQRLVAGKYRLGSKLGEGGMGEVFEAEDIFIRRSVAVKLLRVQSSSQNGAPEQRMHREVMIAGRLTHPNIVTVHDAGFDGTGMYLVMALVNGSTLRQHIKDRGPFSRREAMEITRQILKALRYAHDHGVVHRDLKPANVLMTADGQAKVADFGLAKIRYIEAEKVTRAPSAAMRELTDVGTVMGTIGYMAPEQMLGREADFRSDLFALGAILFEMVQGRPLSDVVKPLRMVSLLKQGLELPHVPELDSGEPIQRLLRRALAPRPADRYQSCEELLRALETIAT